MVLTYVFTYFLVALLCACCGGVIAMHLSIDMGSAREIFYFRLFLLFYIIFCLTNAFWVWVNYGFLSANATGNSMVNLISICACAFFWFYYITARIDPKQLDRLGFRLLSLIPLAIVIALVVSTPWTKLIFYYNDERMYTHGPLYTAMVALALFYLLIAAIRIMHSMLLARSSAKRRDLRALLAFLIYPLAGGLVDMLIPNLPIMELTMMAGVVAVFVSMQGSRIYHDSLTGLANRRRADEFLAEQMVYVSERDPLYFFIADADDFKMINDRYGHIEGDRALRVIAAALREAVGTTNCCLARWGGDEFALIIDYRVLGDPEQIIERIREVLAKKVEEEQLPYRLSLSIGYAVCRSDSILGRELFRRADQMMYQEKERRRQGAGEV